MRRSSAFLAPAFALLAVPLLSACPSDDTTPDDEVSDTTSQESETGETTTTDTTDATTDATTETTQGGGVCGDGVLDEGEQCDDGNTDEGDGCSATCELSSCGFEWSTMETITDGTPGGFSITVDAAGVTHAVGDDSADMIWVASWDVGGGLAWQTTLGEGYGADVVVAGGDLYLIGVDASGADDNMYFARLDASNGDVVWEQTIDSMLGDDVGTGIALTPEGDVVVVGRTRVGDGDDDVWVSKRSADDGSEIWAATWGGMGDGMFSTDRSSAVTVTSDGAIWVGAREHVDFDTQEATLVKFDADGMELDSWQPQAGDTAHQHESYLLASDGTNVYWLIAKYSFPYRHWLYKLDGSGTEQWSKVESDWLLDTLENAEDWQIDGLDIGPNGNLIVGGEMANGDPAEGLDWGEAWVAQLDGSGNVVCRNHLMVDDGDIIPPSLDIFAAGGSAAGIAVTGVLNDTPDSSTWTGFFRP
jgi:cysteine-rich repeat protein